jgi:dephospho-CoA kinase
MGKIVAIVGMCGSGKSIASKYFEDLGYKNVYFGGVTMEKLKEAGLEVTPENEKMMREKLRRELGMGAYAKVLLPRILELSKDYDVVLDGLYSWSELKILEEEFDMSTIAIVCDKNLRYDRLSKRDVRPFNNEEAKKRDITEIENIEKAGPIAYADYFIYNNGSMEEYYKRLDEIIKLL